MRKFLILIAAAGLIAGVAAGVLAAKGSFEPAVVLQQSFGPLKTDTWREFTGVYTGDWQKLGQPFTTFASTFAVPVMAIIIALVAAAFAMHYFVFGPERFEEGGERVKWFTLYNRFVHWSAATLFSIMVLTGLAMWFGKFLHAGQFTTFLRHVHSLFGWLFAVAAVLMFLMWAVKMLPDKSDIEWIKHFGGYLSKKDITLPNKKFHFGQKAWFWLGTVGGLIMLGSGFFLFSFEAPRDTLRLAAFVHLIGALMLVAMFMVHLYMTLFAVKGALHNMTSGEKSIDEIKHMHNAEYQKLKAEGRA